MLRRVFCVAIAALVMGAGSVQASILELELTTTSGVLGVDRFETNQVSNMNVGQLTTLVGYDNSYGVLQALYKRNVGQDDEGTYKNSYDTTFSNTPSNPRDFFVEYLGGAFMNYSKLYLVVKDGNQTPAQYVFDLSPGMALAWDTIGTISGTGFWGNPQGAISHIEFYGAGAIPEPGTMTIWAVGCLAVLGSRLRRRS